MTTAPAGQQSGSPGFLFSGTDVATALEASGVADDVRRQLGGFTDVARTQAVREVERITTELTDLNPVQLIVDALCSFKELREAAGRTLDEPGVAELVELVQHEVDFQHQPVIKVVVNGQQVATLAMVLSLALEIDALAATVRAGRLMALQLGRCDATGSVAIEGRTVAQHQSEVMLPASVPLGAGIALLRSPRDDESPRDDAPPVS
jgi:hypothetical protein